MNDDTTSNFSVSVNDASMIARSRPGEGANETAARAALAAHEWPTFGARLHARLAAIADDRSASDTVVPAARIIRPSAATGTDASRTTRATTAHRNDWRRGAWVTAGLLAMAAALALWAVADGRLRVARPVAVPATATPTPAATDAVIAPVEGITNGFSGRLIYFAPGEGEGNATVFALDMRTGRSKRLWEVPGSEAGAQWAISPDGTRLAYAGMALDNTPPSIYVRHLDAAAPEPLATASLAMIDDSAAAGRSVQVDRLLWSPDGAALYFGAVHMTEAFDGAMPRLDRWELHRLSLAAGDTGTSPQPSGGPLAWGIDAGEDRVLARIAPDDLPQGYVAELLAVDVPNHRAAVAIGPGESRQVDAIHIVDTTTGGLVQERSIGATEAFRFAATVDGSKVAYTTCAGCAAGDYRLSIAALTLASDGDSITIWPTPEGMPFVDALRWSQDGRWLAWSSVAGDQPRMNVVDTSLPPSAPGLAYDDTVATFAPFGGRLLTAQGRLIDLARSMNGSVESIPIAWPLQDLPPFTWVPDIDRTLTPTSATPEAAAAGDAIVLSSVAPTPVPVTPVATVAVTPNPMDIAVGPLLDLDAWSPDGRWLPIWTAERNDWLDPHREAASLRFVDATTGAVCTQGGVRRESRADGVFWPPDGAAVVRVAGRLSTGGPCAPLAPAPASTYALPTARAGETPEWANVEAGDGPVDGPGDSASEPSPDGAFVAWTTAEGDSEDHYVTQLRRAGSDAVLAEARWRGNGGFGTMGSGGTWLPDGRFLVHYSIDKGPLALDPAGTVAAVAETYFGLTPGGPDVAALGASVVVDSDGKRWHLFLTGAGDVRVYHPETQDVETLPSTTLRAEGITPDGRWLVLHGRDGEGGSRGGIWVRALEDRAAPFRRLPGPDRDSAHELPLSPDGRWLALAEDQMPVAAGADGGATVLVLSFPGGEVAGSWRLAGYRLGSVRWSPDSRTLAVDALRDVADAGETGVTHRRDAILSRSLFLLHPPSEP